MRLNLRLAKVFVTFLALNNFCSLTFATPTGSYQAPKSVENIDLQPWPTAGDKLFPSPENWADVSVYSVMVDRFSNGDKTNDCVNLTEIKGQPEDLIHGCQAVNPFHFHGGDLRGVINRLDYVKNMGFSAILLTPVTKTYGQYHGYSPYDFLDIDPNYGSFEDFRELVAEAHMRGIYVILDFVINHTAPVWLYEHSNPYEPPFACQPFNEGSRIPVKGWIGNDLVPKEFMNLDVFSRCGRIGNFDEPYQSENGDFLVYRDLATWKPEVADIMVKIFNYWIAKTDVDGFRLDAIKHVDRRFLTKLLPEVREFAKASGKENLYFVGEAVANDFGYLNYWLGKNFSADGVLTGKYMGLDGVYDTVSYYSSIRSLRYTGEPWLYHVESLAWVDRMAAQVFGQHALLNFRYIDLLDTRRFLDYFEESKKYLHMSLPWVFTSMGIPYLTYGTEQDMYEVKKVEDPETAEVLWNVDWLDPGLGTRGDMVEGGIFRDPKNLEPSDLFREDYSTYLLIQKLNKVRSTFPALRRGLYQQRYFEPQGTGVYAYSRVLGGEEVLIAMNNNADGDKVVNFTGSPVLKGREWVDVLDPNFKIKTTIEMGLEKFELSVGPISSRILVLKADYKKLEK
ncbi:MAG: hypothetical protein KBD78_02090 [Oligoflexales bacterium]|nr:hypothetical protein [Oligoflexales bacterium]